MDERQALWAEYATRWNSYASQGSTAPTKGTEYPFQMAEGYQDAVAFGSGEVSIDLEANYFFPDTLGTVTYKSSAGYSETDVFALCYIFAGEEQANKLLQHFQAYIPTYVPEGINSIQIVLSNANGVFAPSLEFDYQYSEAVAADNGPFGLRSRVTLDKFIDSYNSYIHDENANDDIQVNGEITSAVEVMDELMGYQASYFKYSYTDEYGYDVYGYSRSQFTSMPYTATLSFSNDYIVGVGFIVDATTFTRSTAEQQASLLATLKHVFSSATGLSFDTISEQVSKAVTDKMDSLYRNGLGLRCGGSADGHYLVFQMITITEDRWDEFKAGTLSASGGSASSSNSDPLALSYLDGWSWEANNGDGTSATLLEILDYELLGPSFTATENKADGTVIVEDETSGLAIVFSADGGEPTIPPRSSVSEEEFVALCEDYMNVLRGVQTQ